MAISTNNSETFRVSQEAYKGSLEARGLYIESLEVSRGSLIIAYTDLNSTLLS